MAGGKAKASSAILMGAVVALTLFFAATAADAADEAPSGKANFKTNCVACHGADGGGQMAVGKSLKVPDLRSDAVQKTSDADLAKIIAEGKDNMPSFKSMTDAQIKGLVAYIRELAPKKKAASSK